MDAKDRTYLIIVGAMKSGTTAIFSLLAQHPEICRSYPKEPAFFVKRDYRENDLEEYVKHWECEGQKIKYFMDGSTSYTKMPTFPNAAERIKESGINAKFIYVMRHPLRRIVSQINQSIAKNWITYDKNNQVHYSIINFSMYFMQIKEYYARFPKEDILLLSFEDFTADPAMTMDSICQFLDLSRDFEFNYNKFMRNDGVMYSYMNNRILMNIKLNLRRLKRKVQKKPTYLKMLKQFENLFDRVFGKTKIEISPEDRERIINILKEDLENLRDQYGFDISKWEMNSEIKLQ